MARWRCRTECHGVIGRIVGKEFELLGAGVEPVEARRCSDPYRASVIFAQRPDGIALKRGRVLRVVPKDFERITVVAVQPISSAEPHEAATVLHDTPHGTLGKSLVNRESFDAVLHDIELRISGLLEKQKSEKKQASPCAEHQPCCHDEKGNGKKPGSQNKLMKRNGRKQSTCVAQVAARKVG